MASNKGNKGSGKQQDAGAGKPVRGKQAAAAKNAEPAAPLQWWMTAAQFLREVKNELKKVTWPTKAQTISSTLVVLVLVVIVSAYLGLVDLALTRLVRFVVG